jgi:hypothetical protein
VFDTDRASFEPFRKGQKAPMSAELAALTQEDEHAI